MKSKCNWIICQWITYLNPPNLMPMRFHLASLSFGFYPIVLYMPDWNNSDPLYLVNATSSIRLSGICRVWTRQKLGTRWNLAPASACSLGFLWFVFDNLAPAGVRWSLVIRLMPNCPFFRVFFATSLVGQDKVSDLRQMAQNAIHKHPIFPWQR